jgi:hypothetical protein
VSHLSDPTRCPKRQRKLSKIRSVDRFVAYEGFSQWGLEAQSNSRIFRAIMDSVKQNRPGVDGASCVDNPSRPLETIGAF